MKELEIWGTLGPSCQDEKVLEQLLENGMTGIRLNLSHGNLNSFSQGLKALNEAKKKTGKKCKTLIDMKGPELRIGKLDKTIECKENEIYPLSLFKLPEEVKDILEEKDKIFFDDGKIEGEVLKDGIRILQGGFLTSSKSVFIQNKKVELPALCAADIENIKLAKEYGIDALMQPFVRSLQDLQQVRDVCAKYDSPLEIYAKIENQEGIDNLLQFMPLADCIVIARGDLANAISLEKIGIIQHQIETECHKNHQKYMVVTQMLDSMIQKPCCTRAEANDVFQAVFNGADAIMLTAETAAGKYPVKAMKTFAAIAKNSREYRKSLKA